LLDAAQADLRRVADNNTTQPEDTAHGQSTTTHQGAQQLQEDSHAQHPPAGTKEREDDRSSIDVQISAASEDNQPASSESTSQTAVNEVPSTAAEDNQPSSYCVTTYRYNQ
jgi:hypothetical protein